VKSTELKRAAFKHIESIVYSYDVYQRRIKEVRDNIINGQPEQDENIGAGSNSVRDPGRPTERLAVMLVTDKKLQHYEEAITAVDKAYSMLDEDRQRVIHAKYWGNRDLNWDGVAFECNVHRNTASKYRREFVELVADLLGWE
jgi:RinA family phage transcriptional activator